MSNTLILRIPVAEPLGKSFEERLKDLCNVQAAAGYQVRAMMAMGLDIVVIFQK